MSPESLWEQFDVLVDAPNGVQKLRELILQLAVRGKLVRQKPSDQSADQLLDVIEHAKQHVINERKIGAVRLTELVPAGETPYAIPESWRWVRLGSVGQVVGGGTPNTDLAENWADPRGVPWLTPADLNGLRGKYVFHGRRHISQLGLENSSAQLLPAGSVLFSSRAPIGYVAIAANPLATNQGFKSCVPYVGAMSEYVYWFLRAVGPEVDRNAPGTTFKEVSGKIVAQLAFPLPPVAEQQRIAAKLDELMELCDRLESKQHRRMDVRSGLNRSMLHHISEAADDSELAILWKQLRRNFDLIYDVPDTVGDLRKAVFQLAVRGKLVAQNPNDEPAAKLMDRLATERTRLFRDGQASKARPLLPVGDDVPFALPETWRWVRMGALIDPLRSLSYGVLVPGPDVEAGIPFVRVQDISTLPYPERPKKSIDPAIEEPYRRTRLRGGEILIGVVGSVGTIGVVPQSWAGANIARALCRFAPATGLDREYLALALRSPLVQDYFLEATRTLAQPTLNVSQLELTLIPLPPLAEQRRIVAKVDELMAICDALERRLTLSREKSAQLAASVVHQLTAA